MLRKETASPSLINLAVLLQADSMLHNHILAGGTALSLQIGHRTSVDIDLFSPHKHDYDNIYYHLSNKYNVTELIFKDENILQLMIDNIKVDLVSAKGIFLEPPQTIDGITLFGIKDISSMKLGSILTRTKPKDYTDIAYLIDIFGLKDMVDFHKQKNADHDIFKIKKALLAVNQVNPYEWSEMKMIRNDILLSEVPRIIREAVAGYEKKYEVMPGKTLLSKLFSLSPSDPPLQCLKHSILNKSIGTELPLAIKTDFFTDGDNTISKYYYHDNGKSFYLLEKHNKTASINVFETWYLKRNFNRSEALDFISNIKK